MIAHNAMANHLEIVPRTISNQKFSRPLSYRDYLHGIQYGSSFGSYGLIYARIVNLHNRHKAYQVVSNEKIRDVYLYVLLQLCHAELAGCRTSSLNDKSIVQLKEFVLCYLKWEEERRRSTLCRHLAGFTEIKRWFERHVRWFINIRHWDHHWRITVGDI